MKIKNTGLIMCGGGDVEISIPPHHEAEVCPQWLSGLAGNRLAEPERGLPRGGSYAITALERELGEQGWLDHWGTAVYEGNEYLVSEPYDLNRQKVDQLVRFCDSLGLVFSVQAAGHHYPTRTMRVLVWPKEWPQTDELEFDVAAYEVRADDEWTRDCEAQAAEAEREIAYRRWQQRQGEGADECAQFAVEGHLRDYLARNLDVLEEGMIPWPDRAVEFPTGDGRRADVLARDRDGNPTIIETKVSRGHEWVIGQVLNYRVMLKRRLNATRVRILIVASEASPALLRASSELQDCTVLEYHLQVGFRRPTEGLVRKEPQGRADSGSEG